MELPGNRLDCVRLTLRGLHNKGLFRTPGLVCLVPQAEQNALTFLVQFPAQYPVVPPLFDFLQIPFHPNVRRTGELCYNLLRTDYTPALSVAGLVAGLRVLLEEPNFDDYVDERAAAYYRDLDEARRRAGGRKAEILEGGVDRRRGEDSDTHTEHR